MKKKIFNTLYSNIIFLIILSLGISMFTTAFISEMLFSIDISIINDEKINNIFINEWNSFFKQVTSFKSNENRDIFIHSMPTQNIDSFVINDTYYARVNASGEILSCNGALILINNPPNSNESVNGYISTSMSAIENGNEIIETIIFSPQNHQTISNPSLAEYRFKKICALDDGTYLIAYYITNFDLIALIIGLILFILCFVLMFRGRLKYLENIRKSIKNVSNVDTYTPMSIKYKNELTDIAREVNEVAAMLKANRDDEKEFLLNISHDLRTPLNSMVGFADLLMQDKNLSTEDKQKYLGYVIQKGKYLNTLLEQFFQFAKVKWSNTQLEKRDVDIQELIAQIFEGYIHEMNHRKLDFAFHFESEPIYLSVDVYQFMRAIDNIVTNAIKYSKEGSCINTTITRIENYAIIQIKNTLKINSKDIDTEKIFNRFYRSDSSRTGEGSGLGLAITKAIIEKHDGNIMAKVCNGTIIFTISVKAVDYT